MLMSVLLEAFQMNFGVVWSIWSQMLKVLFLGEDVMSILFCVVDFSLMWGSHPMLLPQKSHRFLIIGA